MSTNREDIPLTGTNWSFGGRPLRPVGHPSKGGEFFTRRKRNDSPPLEGQGWFERIICHRSQYRRKHCNKTQRLDNLLFQKGTSLNTVLRTLYAVCGRFLHNRLIFGVVEPPSSSPFVPLPSVRQRRHAPSPSFCHLRTLQTHKTTHIVH